MPRRRLVLASIVLGLVSTTDGEAARCRVCGFGGLQASEARCVPNAGLVVFSSVPPQVPAYWTLHARRSARRRSERLVGRLHVWADYAGGAPAAPGLPRTCDAADGICSGARAPFRGALAADRLRGAARYPDGARCEFDLTLDFGLGGGTPNRYVCRGATGETTSEGALRVQVLRLLRCRR